MPPPNTPEPDPPHVELHLHHQQPMLAQHKDTRADTVDALLGLQPRFPGSNAFAELQAAQHQHLLGANSFYYDKWMLQQELLLQQGSRQQQASQQQEKRDSEQQQDDGPHPLHNVNMRDGCGGLDDGDSVFQLHNDHEKLSSQGQRDQKCDSSGDDLGNMDMGIKGRGKGKLKFSPVMGQRLMTPIVVQPVLKAPVVGPRKSSLKATCAGEGEARQEVIDRRGLEETGSGLCEEEDLSDDGSDGGEECDVEDDESGFEEEETGLTEREDAQGKQADEEEEEQEEEDDDDTIRVTCPHDQDSGIVASSPLDLKSMDKELPADPPTTSSLPFMIEAQDETTTTFHKATPPLKLVPSPYITDNAQPTRRAFIERRYERQMQISPTPSTETDVIETARSGSVGCAQHALSDKGSAKMSTSPKKSSFMERLRAGWRSTPLRSIPVPASLSSKTKPSLNVDDAARSALLHAQPKAQAVLEGSSLARPPRTPSKRGIFSSHSRENDNATRSRSRSPLKRMSFGILESPSKHATKHTLDELVSKLNRDTYRALKLSDRDSESRSPPTPPAKNTPPDVKSEKTPALGLGLSLDSNLHSPAHSTHIIPNHHHHPRLVTLPSNHNLHASVIPELMDAESFADAKARVDGLDLSGFSLPSESRSPAVGVYSPSLYSPESDREDWGPFLDVPDADDASLAIRRARRRVNAQPSSSASRSVTPQSQISCARDSLALSKIRSASVSTVTIAYPGLSSDPSVVDLTKACCSPPAVELSPSLSVTPSGIGKTDTSTTHPHSHQQADELPYLSPASVGRGGLTSFIIDKHHRQHHYPASYTCGCSSPCTPDSAVDMSKLSDTPRSFHTELVPSPLRQQLPTLPITVFIPPPHRRRAPRQRPKIGLSSGLGECAPTEGAEGDEVKAGREVAGEMTPTRRVDGSGKMQEQGQGQGQMHTPVKKPAMRDQQPQLSPALPSSPEILQSRRAPRQKRGRQKKRSPKTAQGTEIQARVDSSQPSAALTAEGEGAGAETGAEIGSKSTPPDCPSERPPPRLAPLSGQSQGKLPGPTSATLSAFPLHIQSRYQNQHQASSNHDRHAAGREPDNTDETQARLRTYEDQLAAMMRRLEEVERKLAT